MTLNFKEHHLALENKLDSRAAALGYLPTVHTQVGFGRKAAFLSWQKQEHRRYSGGTDDLHSDFTHFSPQRADGDELLEAEDGEGKGKVGTFLSALT